MGKVARRKHEQEGEEDRYGVMEANGLAADQYKVVHDGANGADDEVSAWFPIYSQHLQHTKTIA
jgi:hypothetical protein